MQTGTERRNKAPEKAKESECVGRMLSPTDYFYFCWAVKLLWGSPYTGAAHPCLY